MLNFNRKVFTGSEATVKSLPENIRILNTSLYTTKYVTDNNIFYTTEDAGNTINANKFYGTVGDNYNAFSIEFGSEYYNKSINVNTADTKDDTVEKLYYYIYNDGYSNISKDYLNKNFYIFEISDPSFHTGTMNNYDIQAKVFHNGDIITCRKIVLIKSLTLKTIWVLVAKSKDFKLNESLVTIQLNFIYKYIDTKNSKLPYDGYINANNLVGLVGDSRYPYFENIIISSESQTTDNSTLLNTEGNYYKTSTIMQFGKNFSTEGNAITHDTDLLTKYSFKSKVSNSELKPKTFNIISTNDVAKVISYQNKYSYEIYVFDDTNVGKRALNVIAQGPGVRYEIYQIPPDTVHYIFSYTGKFNIDKFRKEIYGKIYLGDYNFTGNNINLFSEESKKYVDLYLPLPKYGDYQKFSGTINSDKLSDLMLIETMDSRLSYDPTNVNSYDDAHQNKSSKPTDDPFIPYFYSDNGIKKIVDCNKNTSYPIIVTDELNIADLKDANIEDKYFNIVDSKVCRANIQIEVDNNIYKNAIECDRNANKIDINWTNSFNGKGDATSNLWESNFFRNTKVYGSIGNTFDSVNKQLCKNLYKLIRTDHLSSGVSKEININSEDTLFVYFETNNTSNIIDVEFTFAYVNHSGVDINTTKYIRPVKAFNATLNGALESGEPVYKFIIPAYRDEIEKCFLRKLIIKDNIDITKCTFYPNYLIDKP